MRSPQQVLALHDERARDKGMLLGRMHEIRDAYNGDIAIPLPEMDRNEKRSTANLVQQAVDGTSLRIASTMPDLHVPPVKPNMTKHEENADQRRKTILGWWEHSAFDLMLARRAMHLTAYAASPVVIRPDPVTRVPRWSVRDPMGCLPAAVPDHSIDMIPDDAIFYYTRSQQWLRARYPDRTPPATDNRTVRIIEYVDSEQITLIACGQADSYAHSDWTPSPDLTYNVGGRQGRWVAVLEHQPNLAGCPLVIMPGRLTLERMQGQFDSMLGPLHNQARLAALEMIAIEQGIFPEQWVISRQGETAKVIQVANAKQGVIGVISGGQIDTRNINPGYKTDQAIDRLERAARLDGGTPPEFGAESSGNIRTGRRGDQVLSAGVDYNIQQIQRQLARSIEAENRAAIAVAKGWFGKEAKSFYVDWKGAKGTVTYTPNDTFVSDENKVRYSLAGSDLNALVVRSGQLVGTGLISKMSARMMNPEITDAIAEADLVTKESLQDAGISGIQQLIASGTFPPADAARLTQLIVREGKEWFDAVIQVQKEAQARQAADQTAPPGAPEAPVEPGSAESMPGLAAAGMGAEAGVVPSEIPGNGAGAGDLHTLLSQLGRVRTQASA